MNFRGSHSDGSNKKFSSGSDGTLYRNKSMVERPSRVPNHNNTIPTGFTSFRRTKPRLYSCYICGSEFGTASIPIHVKSCFKLHREVWERAAPRTREQQPLPDDPAQLTKEEIYERCTNYNYGDHPDNNSFVEDRAENGGYPVPYIMPREEPPALQKSTTIPTMQAVQRSEEGNAAPRAAGATSALNGGKSRTLANSDLQAPAREKPTSRKPDPSQGTVLERLHGKEVSGIKKQLSDRPFAFHGEGVQEAYRQEARTPEKKLARSQPPYDPDAEFEDRRQAGWSTLYCGLATDPRRAVSLDEAALYAARAPLDTTSHHREGLVRKAPASSSHDGGSHHGHKELAEAPDRRKPHTTQCSSPTTASQSGADDMPPSRARRCDQPIACPHCGDQPAPQHFEAHLRGCIRREVHRNPAIHPPAYSVDDINFCDECGDRVGASSLLAGMCVSCGQELPPFF
eukprot:GGOE01036323.1.p1 GENE.GGOE01036323.1~~GGOE01036323.1.p1  ORF type:complete len:456 (+),score=32.91 GGOE01036323.1:86-1453(+)